MATQHSPLINKAMRSRGEKFQCSRDKTERAHDFLRRRRPVLERALGLPEGDTSMLEVSG